MPVDARWRPSRLVVASGNRHKIVEIERMLSQAAPQLQVSGQADHGSPPSIAETADDFAGNAGLKARGIAAWLRSRGMAGDTAVLADDSGVCVDVLGGAPGVRSARFAGEDATDEDNNARLVEQLQAHGCARSPGHYRCVIALCRVDGEPWPAPVGVVRCFDGRWEVELRIEARGTAGFGYDPHAWLPEEITVAELPPDDKAARSHRGEAMRGLLSWFSSP
ncbi:MAG: non-canonical purine NTP pyrophosphatase [Deltaproteobacteria bacterium]|nr:non-canonical purine NTP pyrophosphatase [Deltaproteobacteria bacterium]